MSLLAHHGEGGQDSLDEGTQLHMGAEEIAIIDAAKELEVLLHEGQEAGPCIVVVDLVYGLVNVDGLELPRQLGVGLGEWGLDDEPFLELGGVLGVQEGGDGREEFVGPSHLAQS